VPSLEKTQIQGEMGGPYGKRTSFQLLSYECIWKLLDELVWIGGRRWANKGLPWCCHQCEMCDWVGESGVVGESSQKHYIMYVARLLF